MRVVAKVAHQGQKILVHKRVSHNVRCPQIELLLNSFQSDQGSRKKTMAQMTDLIRKLAIDEQIGHLNEGAIIDQFNDIIATVREFALGTLDLTDGGLAHCSICITWVVRAIGSQRESLETTRRAAPENFRS